MTGGYGLGRGVRGREVLSYKIQPAEDPTLIAYRAMLDVPRELVCELATLLRAKRRALGTRKGTRLLTCFRQALFVLVWFRTKGDVEIVGAGFRLARATAYRYRDEGVRVLAAQAPEMHPYTHVMSLDTLDVFSFQPPAPAPRYLPDADLLRSEYYSRARSPRRRQTSSEDWSGAERE